MGFFDKLGASLKKTRDSIFETIGSMVTASEITEDMYDDLEEQLILADTGVDVAMDLVERLRKKVRSEHLKTGEQALAALKELIRDMLAADAEMDLSGKPAVILVIGVNGVGKTTSIAKLAHLYREQGKSVLLAAGDTFRAAAAEQLGVWAERAGVPMVRHNEGADPAAVVFDAVQSAAAKKIDIVICDTAGRLHNKKNLMAELSKI
ncbi:signaling recognition particle receptor family protein, partial [uncultured Ruthenibacterium sp.]|uniref:signal recognition particle-docking protein FtsY n=1 Tax=uncultured Ruthenibacterium sp. TaxID=1905347 RepID=UPI00349E59E1